jgi:hypothetical protein
MEPHPPKGYADVLGEEMREILGKDLRTPEQVDTCGTNLGALCLSGGGIRSATFALGVMQGLARFGLLKEFHYLSSVSGGGYIASWLSRWRQLSSDVEVFEALNESAATGEEPPQITGIRADSNYITPQLGLLSADTWTIVALYLRNLLLNWILFVPFFTGCLMAPRLCAALLAHLCDYPRQPLPHLTPESLFNLLRIAGAALAVYGLGCGINGRFRCSGKWLDNGRFCLKVLLPLLVSGTLFTTAAVVLRANRQIPFSQEFAPLWGAGIYFLAWLCGRASSWRATREQFIEWIDVLWWTVSGALVGWLVAVGMIQITAAPLYGTVVFGLSGFMLAYLAGELVYVGLASFSLKGDMDREWLARSSGWISAAVVAFATISAVSLYGPYLLGWIASIIGGVSGLLTLVLGAGSRTGATQAAQAVKSIPWMRLASGAAIVFAILIASLLAWVDQWIEATFAGAGASWRCAPLIDFYFMVGLIAFSTGVSWLINVNRFSMHALYRNRLVRAFLGSARPTGARTADPFTGFDPADNPPLAKVRPKEPQHRRLFHVINAALNVVHFSERKPAWQERKAESFTMTCLHCGNPNVKYRDTAAFGGARRGGLSLGTAMAISGAAVSPNQGYNSSPLIGFLLMLFNIRLGWWLGSPSRENTYYREGPTFSLTPALRELAGDTSEESKWIYLSDGGHFENLGLYEMVRRRCRRIVISDAGCDPTFSFEDLGNAVRKIYIDFGVSIRFDKLEIKARQNPPVPGLRFAIGTIDYPGSKLQGWLLYIKPTYMGTTERADVRSYAAASGTFPHESTTDQWFSESQLEAYRALGATIAEYICSGGEHVNPGEPQAQLTLDDLMIVAARLYSKASRELSR